MDQNSLGRLINPNHTLTPAIIRSTSMDAEVGGQSEGFLIPHMLPPNDQQDLTFEYDPTSSSVTVPLNSLLRGEPTIDIVQDNLSGTNKILLAEGQFEGGTQYTLIEQGSNSYILTAPLTSDSFIVDGDNLLDVITQSRIATEGQDELNLDVHHVSQLSTGPSKPKRTEEKISKPIGKGPYPCPKCKQEFSIWMSLKKHLRSHDDDRRFRCHVCGATYNLQKNLNLHVATHQTENLVCPECGRTFSRSASFKSHLSIHEEEDNLTCPECEQEFANEFRLNEHLDSGHSASSGTLPPRAQQKTEKSSYSNPEEKVKHKLIKKLVKSKQRKRPKSHSKSTFKNKCKYCDKTFKKPSQCIRHERIHTGIKPFKCEVCSKEFNQKNSLDMHFRKHTGLKPHTCQICQISFSQSGNLRAHILRVHMVESSGADEMKFDCGECPCSFKKLGSLNAHVSKFHTPIKTKLQELSHPKDLLSQALQSTGLTKDPDSNDLTATEDLRGHMVLAERGKDGKIRKHLVKIRFCDNIKFHLCNHCDKEFKKPSDLCRHLRVHTLEKPFKCKLCSRAFSVKSALKVHTRIHSSPRVHACSICSKRFATAQILQAHRKEHGEDVGSEPFPCDKCEKVFRTEIHLKAHHDYHRRLELKNSQVKSENNIPLAEPYIITKDGLVQALPRHRSVYQPTRLELLARPFRCDSCPATFKKSSHLKQHHRRHTGVKPFPCKECNKTFVTRGTLNSHMKTHDQEQLFQCSECKATFTTVSSVRRHLASSHATDKKFMCPYCQKTFKTNVLCRKHIKIHKLDAELGKQLVLPTISIQPDAQSVQISESEPPIVQPTFYTADANGIITIPLQQSNNLETIHINPNNIFSGVNPETIFTIKPTEFGIDLIHIENPVTTIQMQTIIKGEVDNKITKKGIIQPEAEIILTADEQPIIQINDKIEIPTQTFSCSWDNCSEKFTTIESLGIHLGTDHATLRGENTRTRKRDEKKLESDSILGQNVDIITDSKTISEKLLLSSLAEKDRVSEIQNSEEVVKAKPKFVNQCLMCPKSFKKPSDLVRHVRTHTGERPFGCDKCTKRFTVKSTLETHRRTHGSSVATIKCHVCSVLFASKTALKTHMRLHTGAKPFLCPHCDHRFRTSGQRKLHMANQHPPADGPSQPIQPTFIPLTIPAASLNSALDAVSRAGEPLLGATVRLQLHGSGLDNAIAQLQVDENLLQQLQRGENIQIVLNPLDDQNQTRYSETNKVHMVSTQVKKKVSENVVIETPEKQSIAKSSVVAETFSNEDLGKILVTDDPVDETEMKDWQVSICPWCDRVLSSDTDRLSHLLDVHNVEIKDFETATRKDDPEDEETEGVDLDIEKAEEEGSNPEDRTCRQCKKVFVKPSQYQRHMRIHTGEKPFVCVTCLKAFNQKNALQIHLKKHSGERPYVCPFCSYAFTQKGNLKTHIQRSHAEQTQELLETSLLQQKVSK